jgi:hypothetical protein
MFLTTKAENTAELPASCTEGNMSQEQEAVKNAV